MGLGGAYKKIRVHFMSDRLRHWDMLGNVTSSIRYTTHVLKHTKNIFDPDFKHNRELFFFFLDMAI